MDNEEVPQTHQAVNLEQVGKAAKSDIVAVFKGVAQALNEKSVKENHKENRQNAINALTKIWAEVGDSESSFSSLAKDGAKNHVNNVIPPSLASPRPTNS